MQPENAGPSKGPLYLANRIAQDALTIAQLLEEIDELRRRVAELDAKLNPPEKKAK